MKHKVLLIISLIFVFSLAVSCICFSFTKSQLDTVQDEYISVKEKGSNTVMDADAEINKLKKQLEGAKENNRRLASAQDVNQIVEEYYFSRYSFNGSPKDNKQRIINGIRSISTKSFRSDLEIELSKSSGNGNVSEDFKHSCSVKSLFVTDIYTKRNNNLGKKAKIYMLNVYALLRLNDNYDAVSVLTLTLSGEKWKISDERIVATEFDDF
jgi:hypothetical protein